MGFAIARGNLRRVPAGVAELAYAGHSKCPGRKALWVRVPPPAPVRRHAMHAATRLLLITATLLPLALAESALAQSREFAGRVVSISAQSITVKDRRGETATFTRGEKTL